MSVVTFIPTLVKYATEARTYSFNFSQVEEILEGDTIQSVNGVTADPNDFVLIISTPVIVGKTVEAEISSGTSGTTYTISCVITTSSGAVVEGQGYLQVD